MCNDSANPWTANCAVDKGSLAPLLLPLERPATEDKIVMCPLPASCIRGRIESNNYDNYVIYITIEVCTNENVFQKICLPKNG